MNRVWLTMMGAALAGLAAAQGTTVLYVPVRELKDQGISLKAWGSGAVSETDEQAFEGTHSVRMSTRNFFQGGAMTFSKPVDLSSDFGSKTNLLRVTVKLADAGSASSGGGAPKGGAGAGLSSGGAAGGPPGLGGVGKGGGRGGGQSGPGGGFPGGGRGQGGPGFPGGGRGQGGPGFPGAPGGGFSGGGPGQGFPGSKAGGGTSSEDESLKTLRLIVTTTDNKRSEAYIPINTNAKNERGWLSMAVPLQAITGLDRTNKQIKEIAIAGDATATFYVGDVRIVNDSTPIRGEIQNAQELNLSLGQQVDLTAYGEAGTSVLRYTWDFDDRDGVQVDAEGQAVRHRFRKAGTFNVTLTVSDLYGLKQPYTTTIKVVVNP